jgi:hypothetical protein
MPAGATAAAFEIKSLAGDFRRWQAGINRDQRSGAEVIGRVHTATWRGANDVLRTAGAEQLRKACGQLGRKVGPDVSANAFLIAHMLDYPVVECVYPVIGRLLDPPPDCGSLATVWMLWVPGHLTIWSAARHEWIDVIVCRSPDDGCRPDALTVLQDVEGYFLSKIGHQGVSPFMFGLSVGDAEGL